MNSSFFPLIKLFAVLFLSVFFKVHYVKVTGWLPNLLRCHQIAINISGIFLSVAKAMLYV